MTEKHLVYAEDIIWKIMQHPSKIISKGLLKQLIDEVVSEKEVKLSELVELNKIDGGASRT